MATILVDYENVRELGLHGATYLNDGDTLIIFYSEFANKMNEVLFDNIRDSGCKVEVIKLERKGKNGLDFYIATKIGYIIGTEKENWFGIVSKDKGYHAVLDYWKSNNRKITVVQGCDIVRTLSQMGDPQNKVRREMMLRECREVDIEIGFRNLINKQNEMQRMKEMFAEYPDDLETILEFIKNPNKLSNKERYLGCMKVFGISKGRSVYNKIKEMNNNGNGIIYE